MSPRKHTLRCDSTVAHRNVLVIGALPDQIAQEPRGKTFAFVKLVVKMLQMKKLREI